MTVTRRTFLSRTAIAVGALPFAAPAFGCLGANEQIRAAVVGIRSRGRALINGLQRLDGVQVVALCDVDAEVLQREAQRFEKDHGASVDAVADVRRLLDRDDIDVIATATPNHWHALITIWACQAGKDVYVEKPVSHSVWEGEQMVAAAARYGRIVATGTQCRSSGGIAEAVAWVREGNLGRITLARGLCYKPRKSIGTVRGPRGVPTHIDYDLWCGPSSMGPLMRKNLHYDWHWDFRTGNGDLGNQGIHQVDICRWFLGERNLSSHVMSVGGRFAYADDANTPNTLVTMHLFDTAPLVFEVRGLPRDKAAQTEDWNGRMDRFMGAGIGCIIHCEGGHVLVPNYNSAVAFDAEGREIKRWNGARDHFANFIDAVRSRRREDLAADIVEGHVSSALCHTGNISYLTGRAASLEDTLAIVKGPELTETVDRMVGHLESNGVKLDADQLTVGRPLRMDPATNRFIDDDFANSMLRASYRAPFVVPEIGVA